MNTKSVLFFVLSFCLMTIVVFSGCNGDGGSSPTTPDTMLVDQNVTVPGGGGFVDVTFSANNGQTIRITLTASSNMDPYGYLTYPNGAGEYYPDLQTAQNGVNVVEITLNQTGTYTLSIFDGTNRGGTVQAQVEVL